MGGGVPVGERGRRRRRALVGAGVAGDEIGLGGGRPLHRPVSDRLIAQDGLVVSRRRRAACARGAAPSSPRSACLTACSRASGPARPRCATGGGASLAPLPPCPPVPVAPPVL